MFAAYLHRIDPQWFRIGSFVGVRYYTAIFALAYLLGFLFWYWQARRGGHPRRPIWLFLPICFVAITVFARLGHCLFYYPGYYLSHPLEMLVVWKGGLASHGATIGLVSALILWARWQKTPALTVIDRFSFTAATGAALVRLGNWFNSEIVGRETDVPWGVRFFRYDTGYTIRHPSQLYEFAIGVIVLVALLVADRLAGKEKRPTGLLTGVFFTGYFSLRFLVEFFKEHQTLDPSNPLTLGQYLSIPMFLGGVAVLVWMARRQRGRRAA